jgi:hypothetical protein
VFARFKTFAGDQAGLPMAKVLEQVHAAAGVYRDFTIASTQIGPIDRLGLFGYRTGVLESEVIKPLVLCLLDPEFLHAGSPEPATLLVAAFRQGLSESGYVEGRNVTISSAAAMTHDLETGEIDAGILWGPMAGYFARQSSPAMTVVPLVKETGGPRLVYRIAMGVRFADQDWKRLLNRTIQENQPAINRILLSFGVPLLDDRDRPITEGATAK